MAPCISGTGAAYTGATLAANVAYSRPSTGALLDLLQASLSILEEGGRTGRLGRWKTTIDRLNRLREHS
jgi:hypothetical protein